MRTFIYPYNSASVSAKKLSRALGAKRLKRENSKYRYKEGDVIINWGCTQINNPEVIQARILNQPYWVNITSNKKSFCNVYQADRSWLIPYTTQRDEAYLWSIDGHTVVARHTLNGHSGEGIELVEPHMLMPHAPLYTMYKKKTDEYRAHFINNKIVKFARKGRKLDVPDDEVNWKVRNLDGGFVYALVDYDDLPAVVIEACEDYAHKSMLYFGAIDVIYHKPTDKAYILEVNTAPGLSGSTIEVYAEALKIG